MPTSLILNKKFKIKSTARRLNNRPNEYEDFYESDPVYKTLSKIFSDYKAPRGSENENHYAIKIANNLFGSSTYDVNNALTDLSSYVTNLLTGKIYVCNTPDFKHDHTAKLNMICSNVVFVNKENENDIVLFKLMKLEVYCDCKWIDDKQQYSIEDGEISLLSDEMELRQNFKSFWDFAKYIRFEGK